MGLSLHNPQQQNTSAARGVLPNIHPPFRLQQGPKPILVVDQDPPYGGIGIMGRSTKEGILVRELISKGPAEQAGIKVGDVITQVNNIDAKTRTDDAIKELRSSDDERVDLLVKPNQGGHGSSQPKNYTLLRMSIFED